MKKKMHNSNNSDMRDEYDFSGGIRGKHYKAYRKGHAVIVHKEDGSASVQYFTQEEGSVMLDPDVKVHFPDSESVNKALRSLIA
jgi:tRNA isopentenyl-2-thiomethyl-A-37 hydroxylase MiaE